MSSKKKEEVQDKITRIAIVDANRCKPKRCAQECKKVRAVVCHGQIVALILARFNTSHAQSSRWVRRTALRGRSAVTDME